MQIIGINTLTLIDFPQKTACIVFAPGCNFRCGYCYNADYVLPERLEKYKEHLIPEEVFFNFLATRRGLLDGVVISGGEPTLQLNLIPFIQKIKAQNFLVKLDTNGTRPEILQKLIEQNLLDYIAMDLKTAPEQYSEIVNVPVDLNKIIQSRDLIINPSIDYEFRTTFIREHHTQKTLTAMAEFLEGAKRLALQNFEKYNVLDPKYLTYSKFTPAEMQTTAKFFQKYIPEIIIR